MARSWSLPRGPFHLDYKQHLEPYVDGKANDIDREIVESHVALCSNCATELDDLLQFKQQPPAAIAGDARASSVEESEREFQALAKANPDSTAVRFVDDLSAGGKPQ